MDGKAAETCARARELHGALPEPRHCNRLLRLLVERRRWEDARRLYDEMLAEDGGADNYSTCVMVRGLCLEGRKLIEARWGAECVPHVVFYNVLIDGYCRRGDIGWALLLLGDMETKGFLPTVVTYGAIINWLGRKGDLEKIGSLLQEMRVKGLCPNVQVYNTLIDALCKWQSASQAMAVLKLMFASGCDPDVVTFNTLISAFCRAGDVRQAVQLLREAIRRELEPNQLSYTSLIHGFCISGEVMVASDLLVEMMGRGHTPDVVTFGALIHGLVVAGQLNEALMVCEKMKRMLPAAKNLVAEMLEQNVQPDKFVYTTLIDGFIRSENLDYARKIFEFMEQKGVCPDVVVYNAMIKGYCKFGMMGEVILCMSSMRKAGCTPDEFTYTTLIDGYAKQGDTDNAEDLFANMQSEGLFPNVVHYTILIGSLFKKEKLAEPRAHGDPDRHVEVPDLSAGVRMARGGPGPTCGGPGPRPQVLSISTSGTRGDTGPVPEREAGPGPLVRMPCIINLTSHSTVKVHNRSALLDAFKGMALNLKDEMAKKGYAPDPVTFLSLLYGFCSIGKPSNWRGVLPNEFQQDEFEIIFRYKTLFDQHVVKSVSLEVYRVLQLYAKEFQFIQQPDQRIVCS
ncbi:hypothetical protein PVAP13_3KG043270 [Panicum virgatum]|uniref:Pentatricopeptide repeat-containing protein n=1 Tax=Panicum virgatum TaxID=38727 RepID=A0A8T0UPR4_PANVG|nr:hypothetical protein PVAP13_3KG043270 [Panicum virgatum]